MLLDFRTLTLVARPLTPEQGLQILKRDHFVCQYCGLDGMASFENALVRSVDFLYPRAHTGRKHPRNLVACCRPCNMLKALILLHFSSNLSWFSIGSCSEYA